MEALYELIVNAYTKFLAAGLSIDHARFGVFGIWIGSPDNKPQPASDSQLDFARASRDAWSKSFGNLPNPYADLVSFYETGASLGRWENHVLDVFGPDGGKLWGIPRSTLINAFKSMSCGMCGTGTLVGTDCKHCGNRLVGTTDPSQLMSAPIDEFERANLSDSDRRLFLAAWAGFGRTERCDVCCDVCGDTIMFEKTGTSLKHCCTCGKFTGSLRTR